MVWSSWSVIDNISPELFTFGFDPEILSCFWGLFRSSNDIDLSGATPARIPIPRAPFQIIIPFQNSEKTTLSSILHCFFATSGVVLVVSLSSYGMYNILTAARGKLLKTKSPLVTNDMILNDGGGGISALNQFDFQYSNTINNPYSQLQLEASSSTPQNNNNNGQEEEGQSQNGHQLPIRPTSLSVGLRSDAASLVGGLFRPFRLRNNNHATTFKDVDLDLDDLDDMQDIQGEYFGPATVDLDNELLSFDDNSSEYKTPCAAPYDF